MHMTRLHYRHYALIALIAVLGACQTAYYGAMEKVGIHKRDIMIDRVGNARDAQQDAKQEFSSALEQFQTLFGRLDIDLQEQYDKLNSAYEDSEDAADEVADRIDAVEDVSDALFDEWAEELELYTNQQLRRESERQMNSTRRSYAQLIKAMRTAEQRMAPVLNAFRDQVLFLKHNLNARAIDGLRGELSKIETDVANLIAEMERSIAEAEAFIATLE